jgi:hypothetical protein
VETAKVLINEDIAEKFDINELISSPCIFLKLFNIADLGCSVGPNTFIVVGNIIDSVKLKYQSFGPNQGALEFQVFFKIKYKRRQKNEVLLRRVTLSLSLRNYLPPPEKVCKWVTSKYFSRIQWSPETSVVLVAFCTNEN